MGPVIKNNGCANAFNEMNNQQVQVLLCRVFENICTFSLTESVAAKLISLVTSIITLHQVLVCIVWKESYFWSNILFRAQQITKYPFDPQLASKFCNHLKTTSQAGPENYVFLNYYLIITRSKKVVRNFFVNRRKSYEILRRMNPNRDLLTI